MKYSKLAPIALSGETSSRFGVHRTARIAHAPLMLFAFAACAFPRPADVGDDGGPADSPVPGVTVHVSPAGEDANDGFVLPVKTLNRAIGLAVANTKITQIVLASGAYSISSGETAGRRSV